MKRINKSDTNTNHQSSPVSVVPNSLVIDESTDEITKYTDKQFEIDYPERLIQCRQCKTKFPTRFDAKYCSDKCFNRMIREHRKKIGTWVKANKRVYLKSTHRPDKNWKNPREQDNSSVNNSVKG